MTTTAATRASRAGSSTSPSRVTSALAGSAEGVVVVAGAVSLVVLLLLIPRSFVANAPILRGALATTFGWIVAIAWVGGAIGGTIWPGARRAAGGAALAGVAGFVCLQWVWTGWDGQNLDVVFVEGPLFSMARLRALVVFSGGIVGTAIIWRFVGGVFAGPDSLGRRWGVLLAPAVLLALVLMLAPAVSSGSGKDRPRVALVGVDAATFEILEMLSQKTDLPAFDRLLAEGSSGRLLPEPPFSPPSWVTLATGKLPENHGVDTWDRNNRATGKRDRFYLSAIQAKTIFEIVEDYEMPNAVFEWPVVGREADGLEHPIDQTFGLLLSFGRRMPFLFEAIRLFNTPRHDRPDMIYKRNETGLIILSHYFWGLLEPAVLGVGIKSTDSMQHKYWASFESEAYEGVVDDLERFADNVPEIYRIADEIIGGFIEDPDTDVIIFSDHGARGISSRDPSPVAAGFKLRIHPFLKSWGYLDYAEGDPKKRPNFESTRLYDCSDTSLHAQVCVNMTEVRSRATGQGPDELLEGQGREDIEDAAARFARLRFEDDGSPLFPGEYGTRWNGADLTQSYLKIDPDLPDVFFPNFDNFDLELGQGFKVRAFDPNLMDRVITDGEYRWTLGDVLESKRNEGTHEVYGMVAVMGPSFKGGDRIEGARTADLVPTALHILGIPVGADMDGRVLSEAFRAESDAARREIRTVASHEPEGWQRAEQNEITSYERRLDQDLKGLGYIN